MLFLLIQVAMSKFHIDLAEIHQIGKDTNECLVPNGTVAQMATYNMRTVGYSDAGLDYRMIRRNPNFVHLLVCTGGVGHVLIDGQWVICDAGKGYFAPAGPMHGFKTIPGQRWSILWMFYGAPVDQPALIAGDKPLLLNVDYRALELSLKGLHLEYSSDASPMVMAQWVDLLHGYVLAITRPAHTYDRLWRLWERVNADLSAPWSLDQLAEEAAIGPEQLRRLCLASLGHSPMQHVAHLRMRKAASLLIATPMKISVIAQLVGYSNPFAFSNTFRRMMGQSPSQFRTPRISNEFRD